MSQSALLDRAYQEGKELVAAGNGFTFRIRTKAGDVFEGPPDSSAPIETPIDLIIRLEFGSDTVFIPAGSIESLTVIAAA